MHFSCRINKARIQTHTIPIFNIYWFPPTAVLREHASTLCYGHINSLVLQWVYSKGICELLVVINTIFFIIPYLYVIIWYLIFSGLVSYFPPRHTTETETFKASGSSSCRLYREFLPPSKIQDVLTINHKTCFSITPKSIFCRTCTIIRNSLVLYRF